MGFFWVTWIGIKWWWMCWEEIRPAMMITGRMNGWDISSWLRKDLRASPQGYGGSLTGQMARILSKDNRKTSHHQSRITEVLSIQICLLSYPFLKWCWVYLNFRKSYGPMVFCLHLNDYDTSDVELFIRWQGLARLLLKDLCHVSPTVFDQVLLRAIWDHMD